MSLIISSVRYNIIVFYIIICIYYYIIYYYLLYNLLWCYDFCKSFNLKGHWMLQRHMTLLPCGWGVKQFPVNFLD